MVPEMPKHFMEQERSETVRYMWPHNLILLNRITQPETNLKYKLSVPVSRGISGSLRGLEKGNDENSVMQGESSMTRKMRLVRFIAGRASGTCSQLRAHGLIKSRTPD